MFLGVIELVRFMYGLEDDTWVQLWAGAIGAIPAAVVSAAAAAWVAVSVLNRSNRHQQILAERAAREQRHIARSQLEEQRSLTEKQLDVQREETARTRERDAMASVSTEAYGFVDACAAEVKDVSWQLRQYRTAVMKWELEMGVSGRELGKLLWRLGNSFHRAGLGAAVDEKGGRGLRAKEFERVVIEGVSSLHVFLIAWKGSHEPLDAERLKFLGAKVAGMELQLAKIDEKKADIDPTPV